MSIRVKIILVIMLIVVVITTANLGMGLIFTQNNIVETVKSHIEVIGEIADDLISTQIALLKADVFSVSQYLLGTPDEMLGLLLEEQLAAHETFLALTVFDREQIMTSCGFAPAPLSLLGGSFIEKAFAGESVISTTRRDPSGVLVFDVCVPMGTRVLSATVPGDLFSDLLSGFRIWKTGNIFILDGEGTMIANIRPFMVEERHNYIERAQTDPSVQEMGEFYSQMIQGGRGVGEYNYLDVENICFYTSNTGSSVGWVLGVTAPLSESPTTYVQHGLTLTALIFLALGFLVSLLLSGNLAKPFNKINEQNESLAELNEVAKHASEAKSRFLANTSHEMRTPLNAIIGLSELILNEGIADGELRENLEKIHSSGATLLGIVNDLLDISKIESGKFELIPVEYDVPSMINDTISLNIMRIGDKSIKFIPIIDPALPCRLFGDELKVKGVFNNLLSNAFKYTKEGTVEWHLSCERDGENVWVVSSVKDSGIGIRPEDVEKLFSDYNQVDTKSNRTIEGTGLGLAITKRVTEMMDGHIAVTSEYGKGSVFSVRFRQGFVSDVPLGREVTEHLEHFEYLEQKRTWHAKLVRIRLPYAKVLVVDDVSTNLDVARGMMKSYGMQVDCVTSGPQAIELVRNEKVHYNAIFMDHMMPGMDGIEAVRIIREEIGTDYAKNVPIIALTANAIIGNEEMFLRHGFQAFLSKPIDIGRMDELIRRWVRDKEQEEALAAAQEETAAEQGSQEAAPAPAGPAKTWNIAGLDWKKGLERFWDDEDSLIEVLRSYAENTSPLLDQVRACSEETLPAYAVVVHGIKGSSYGICADAVGKQAEALEHAAKAGDIAFVKANNEAFIRAAEQLISELSAMLKTVDAETQKAKKEAPDAGTLHRLQEACAHFDMDGVDKAMEELEGYEYETQSDLISWLRDRVALMDLQQIQERLSAF
ncbi:MAG: response regulator [Oscillospiraceae bacterium]|jgi:signal transduction histidine kinase/CheY-like chemotaxis protein|nr:response regulator [Oscillospiraceae bacterium]